MEIRFDGPGRLVIDGIAIDAGGTADLTDEQITRLDRNNIEFTTVVPPVPVIVKKPRPARTKTTKNPKPEAAADGPNKKEA